MMLITSNEKYAVPVPIKSSGIFKSFKNGYARGIMTARIPQPIKIHRKKSVLIWVLTFCMSPSP